MAGGCFSGIALEDTFCETGGHTCCGNKCKSGAFPQPWDVDTRMDEPTQHNDDDNLAAGQLPVPASALGSLGRAVACREDGFNEDPCILKDGSDDDPGVFQGEGVAVAARAAKGGKESHKSCGTDVGGRGADTQLTEELVLGEAWWFLYCCCGGCGCGRESAILHLLCKCLICRLLCETTECRSKADGLCQFVQSCCCCSTLGQLPRRNGSPRCMLCAEHWGGLYRNEKSHEAEPHGLYDDVLHESCMLCYLLCCGIALRRKNPYSGLLFSKCLCCRGSISAFLWTWRCLYAQCRLPPQTVSNPLCGLCGCRMRQTRKTKALRQEQIAAKRLGGMISPCQQDMA